MASCGGSTTTPSWDGRVLAYRTDTTLVGLDLQTGARWDWVDSDQVFHHFQGHLGGANEEVTFRTVDYYPVDADNLFIVGGSSTTRVFHVDGAGEITFRLDLAQQACADGLNLCPGQPEPYSKALYGPGVHPRAHVLGWHSGLGRLLLGVPAFGELFVVGLHPTEPPNVVLRSHALHGLARNDYEFWLRGPEIPGDGLPLRLQPTGHGELFSEFDLFTPQFQRLPKNPFAYLQGQAIPQLTGVWGDTLLSTDTGNEWVRYERRVQPGDTLLLRQAERPLLEGGYDEGYMLYAIGPRGGANPLWDDLDMALRGVTGMDVSATGDLCIADRFGKQLIELAPHTDGSLIPSLPSVRIEDVEPIDCLYDGDDLLVLVAAPYAVLRLDRATETLVPHLSIPDDPRAPGQLVAGPDGPELLRVPQDGGDPMGALHRADGTLFTLGSYTWQGASQPRKTDGTMAHLAERPDGRVVALYYRPGLGVGSGDDLDEEPPTLLDVDSGHSYPLVVLDRATSRSALAQVPGGLPVDPWTGEPGPTHWPPPSSSQAPGLGPAPGHPSGGQADPDRQRSAPGDDDDGCAASGSSPLPLALTLLTLAWLRARIRAPAERTTRRRSR